MCFQADFDEADSCEAILDKKYGLLLMSRVDSYGFLQLVLSSLCLGVRLFPSSGLKALWSTLQEGQEFSKGPFVGGGKGKKLLFFKKI